VTDHLVSVVPMGVLVSGGLDSSLVAAFSARAFRERGEQGAAFSMVPGGVAARLDETPHIERVVSSFGLVPHRIALTPDWLKANIGAVTRAQEEPVAGIAVAAQYLTYELAARIGTRVVLDGQGADELFGGYPRHQFAYLRNCLRRHAYATFAAEIAWLCARDRALFRDTLRHSRFFRANGQGAQHASPPSLDAVLRRDVASGNMRSILALTDRNAMAHSVEGRVPYVHRPVVEAAFGLADAYKVGHGTRKRILRRIGERHLPASIVRRRDRIGFGAPTREWLLRHFQDELRALHGQPAFAGAHAIDARRVHDVVDGFLASRHTDAGKVWRLFAIERWAREYEVTAL
jgi:asparagine synthase (glutamine-hydrolysing)